MMLSSSPLASTPIASAGGQTINVSATLSGASQLTPLVELQAGLSAHLFAVMEFFETTSAKLTATSTIAARADEEQDYTVTLKATSTATIRQPKMNMLAQARIKGNATVNANATVVRIASARLSAFSTASGVMRDTMNVRATLSGKGKVTANANVNGQLSARLSVSGKLKANAILYTVGSPTIASGLMRPPSVYRQPMRLV